MAQEEHTQRCSNSSSGGGGGSGGGAGGGGGNRYSSSSSLKKATKQKKVPQRGLGVAQLEKIRLEEQQKKDGGVAPNSIISPTNSSSCLASLQCTPNFRPNNNNNISSLPLPHSPTTDLPIFKPPPSSIPNNIDVLRPNLTKNMMNITAGDPIMGGWPAGSGPPGNWWNGGEFSNMGLPYESDTTTPIWPPPNVIQRSHHFQQPFSSSMVNVSSGTSTSSSSSSVMNFQMEPPSNQSYCGNNYTTLMWPEEEKMVVGMKRPYPFIIENAPGPCFPKFHPPPPPHTYLSPLSRSDESASCSHGITAANIEPPIPAFREMPSSSSGITERNPKRNLTENAGLNGDFLTLAPPTISQPNSRQRHVPSSYIPEFEHLPYQDGGEGPIRAPGPGGPIQQPFFSFLPSVKTRNGQDASNISISSSSSSNGEIRENVDLNLKL